MDGGAWWGAVYGVTQSRTRLKRLSSSSSSRDLNAKFWLKWLLGDGAANGSKQQCFYDAWGSLHKACPHPWKSPTVTQARAWSPLQNTCPEKESNGPRGNEPESYCLKDESDAVGHIVTETQLTQVHSTSCIYWVCSVAQSCLTLCNAMDCSLPGSSIHVIFQVSILERVAISYPTGSSWPRDQMLVCALAGRFFTTSATWEAVYIW